VNKVGRVCGLRFAVANRISAVRGSTFRDLSIGTLHYGALWSIAGGGIYFATTPELTGHKAHKKGVILEVTVALGKIHTLYP